MSKRHKIILLIASIAAAFVLSACHSGKSATAICVDSKPISNLGITFAQYQAGGTSWANCAGDNRPAGTAQCGWEGKYAEDPHKSYDVHCVFANGQVVNSVEELEQMNFAVAA